MRLENFESLKIKSNLRDYEIFFVQNDDFLRKLKDTKNSVFIIDSVLWDLHKNDSLKYFQDCENKIIFEVKEEVKNIEGVETIYDEIIKLAPKKNLTIISIGGGIIQDLTGFVASTLYRGVKWIFIPSTLLAQDDSCIGAKTSLNYKKYKNLVGTFYPPHEVYIYAKFLTTLSDEDYASGVGEMAKLHLLGGENDAKNFQEFIDAILNRDQNIVISLIKRCLKIKQDFIENDEFDEGRRNLLNYGHCFGHAIEYATNFAVPHGQAVALGMIIANIAAVNRNILTKEQEKYLREKILEKILVIDFKKLKLDNDMIVDAMSRDKKNIGSGFALIVLDDKYNFSKITDLTAQEATNAMAEFKNIYGKN